MTELEERAEERRRRRVAMARVVRLTDDDGSFDLTFWRAVGHEGRFAAAWEMVTERLAMRGGDADEPRLQRSVLVLRRR